MVRCLIKKFLSLNIKPVQIMSLFSLPRQLRIATHQAVSVLVSFYWRDSLSEKRYYYLKLEETYFNRKVEKAMRKLPSGSEMLVCYLKMQLKYLSSEGFIIHSGIYDTIQEEISLEIDEPLDIVKMTLNLLLRWGYIDQIDKGLYLNDVQQRIGSKTDVALRVQKHREKVKLLKEKDDKLLQCNKKVTQYRDRVDKELDKELELDIYSHWNTKNIIKHKELTIEMSNKIHTTLKKYSEEKIKLGIDRYSTVLNSGDYYFSYKWTLVEFLSRENGLPIFSNEEIPLDRYKKSKQSKNLSHGKKLVDDDKWGYE